MSFQRWLVVGLCFCVFCGCKSAQSHYDYCGPMPGEGGNFLYRKNSILGGDPAMKRVEEEAPGEQDNAGEEGPEPTPAPPPDEQPAPGADMEGDGPATERETAPDEAANEMSDEELADEGLDPESRDDLAELEDDLDGEVTEGEPEDNPSSASTTEWHAPSKGDRSPIRQVRFRGE